MEDEIATGARERPNGSALEEKRRDGKRNKKRANVSNAKAPTQPFATTPEPLRARLRELVEIYYGAQFGGVRLPKDRVDEWNGVLNEAFALWA